MMTLTFEGKNLEDICNQMQNFLNTLRMNPPAPDGVVARTLIPERYFEVVQSYHSDINNGDKGKLIKERDGGVELEFTKDFQEPGRPEVRNRETRGIFFSYTQVQEV